MIYKKIYLDENDKDVFLEAYIADKLAREGVKFELHIYPDAPHGVALGNKITSCGEEKWENAQIAKWVEQAARWAESL